MHRIVKKTLQYTGFLFLSLIVLLIAGISYLYFSADMQTPKHEQSMTTDKVIDIDSLHLRHYGDNFLRHSDRTIKCGMINCSIRDGLPTV